MAEHTSLQNPGRVSSAVRLPPPISSRASSSSTSSPSRASSAAAVSPLGPPPTTTTSCVSALKQLPGSTGWPPGASPCPADEHRGKQDVGHHTSEEMLSSRLHGGIS